MSKMENGVFNGVFQGPAYVARSRYRAIARPGPAGIALRLFAVPALIVLVSVSQVLAG